MLIQETYINATKGYCFGEGEPYEPFADEIGRLFRDMQREYGRCISQIYIDGPDKTPRPVGWVFRKTMVYEEARAGNRNATYIREVWVTCLDECEHGDPDELAKVQGRDHIQTGLKYHFFT